MANVGFRHGTLAEYNQIAHDDNILYFVEDTGKIYKGETDVTKVFVLVSHEEYKHLTPQNTVVGQFYIDTQTSGIKIREVFLDPSGITVDRIKILFSGEPVTLGNLAFQDSASAEYIPEGTISAPSATYTTESVPAITKVVPGELPSYTVEDSVLTLKEGTQLQTESTEVVLKITSIEVGAPEFTGISATITVT